MLEAWTAWLDQSMLWIQHSGWIGWVWFIILYTLSCVLFLPGSALSFGAGAIYGFWAGTMLVSMGSVGGAAANFLTAKYLLRGWMARKFARSRKFHALDHAATTDGWRLIMLTRISPVLPHSLVSCAFGLSRISFWQYILASWIGFLPISAAYAYGGAILGKAAKRGIHQRPGDWMLYALEIVMTILLTIWITRAAQKALKTCAPDVADAIGEEDESLPDQRNNRPDTEGYKIPMSGSKAG